MLFRYPCVRMFSGQTHSADQRMAYKPIFICFRTARKSYISIKRQFYPKSCMGKCTIGRRSKKIFTCLTKICILCTKYIIFHVSKWHRIFSADTHRFRCAMVPPGIYHWSSSLTIFGIHMYHKDAFCDTRYIPTSKWDRIFYCFPMMLHTIHIY